MPQPNEAMRELAATPAVFMDSDGVPHCAHCGCVLGKHATPHAPDCLWLKAQERRPPALCAFDACEETAEGASLAPITEAELKPMAFCGGMRPTEGEVIHFAQEPGNYYVWLCDAMADWGDGVPVDMCRVLDHHPTEDEVAVLVASRDRRTKPAFPH